MGYVRAWIRNIISDLVVVGGVCFFMYIFLRVFYPDALNVVLASGQAGVSLVNALRLWPVVVLAVIVYALPRHWHRR